MKQKSIWVFLVALVVLIAGIICSVMCAGLNVFFLSSTLGFRLKLISILCIVIGLFGMLGSAKFVWQAIQNILAAQKEKKEAEQQAKAEQAKQEQERLQAQAKVAAAEHAAKVAAAKAKAAAAAAEKAAALAAAKEASAKAAAKLAAEKADAANTPPQEDDDATEIISPVTVAPPKAVGASSTKFCSKCGADNPEKAKFCRKCGNKLI